MCGRFVLSTVGQGLVDVIDHVVGEEFGPVTAPFGAPPKKRYNIAPTTPVAVLVPEKAIAEFLGGRKQAENTSERLILAPARWGLLPQWVRDKKGPLLINARAETVASKPSFRAAFHDGRALVPMNGYYEWHDKKPYFVTIPGEKILFAAALVATGLHQLSTTIVTTASAEPIDWLHHRMPRLLDHDEWEQWLYGTSEEARALLHPTPARMRDKITLHRVATPVGSVHNEGPSQ